jgi:phosphopantetheine adenylyltransferase
MRKNLWRDLCDLNAMLYEIQLDLLKSNIPPEIFSIYLISKNQTAKLLGQYKTQLQEINTEDA